MRSTSPLRVVVAGGGVAAIEAVLALHDLAGDRVQLTIVAPERDFTLRPLRTAEPFAADHVRVHSLEELAGRVGAELRADTVAGVEPERRAVRLASGGALDYDALLLAVGARHRTAFARAITFAGDEPSTAFNGLLADLDEGWSRSVAFVVPPGITWPLPLYELALMTAAEVRSMGIDDARLTIISPEAGPLALFGPQASEAISGLLDDAGIAFRGASYAVVDAEGVLRVAPGGTRLDAERVVALPTIEGPQLFGVPSDDRGFIPIDHQCRVRGLDDVFAAGDGTTFPVKQGGLACQMADAIAEQLAVRVGTHIDPAPFRPVLHGHLLTPAGAQALEHPLHGGAGGGPRPLLRLWSPAHKINGRYLSAWLQGLEAATSTAPPRPEPPAGVEVEVPLLNAWQEGQLAMRLDPYGPLTVRQSI